MENQDIMEEELPFIIFRIKDSLFCVNSRYIERLLQLPEFVTLPQSPPVFTGIFPYRDNFITMFDIRTAFGMENLAEEFAAFSDMLEQRKEDHIQWVTELERSIQTGDEFTLSDDPHACAFGVWYDNFESDNHLIISHLKKIEEPHNQLHHAANEVEECMHINDSQERESKLQQILSHIKHELMPAITGLLDETKDVFYATQFREMVLVLSDSRLGLVVDEVLSVEYLLLEKQENKLINSNCSDYICGVRESETYSDIILELDIPQIKKTADTY